MTTAQATENFVLSEDTKRAIESLTTFLVADQSKTQGNAAETADAATRGLPAVSAAPAVVDDEAQRFLGFASIATSIICNVVAPKVIGYLARRRRELGLPERGLDGANRDMETVLTALLPAVVGGAGPTDDGDGRDMQPGADAQMPASEDATPATDADEQGDDRGFWGWVAKKARIAATAALEAVVRGNVNRGLAADDGFERKFEQVFSELWPAILQAHPEAPNAAAGATAVPAAGAAVADGPAAGNGTPAW